MNEEMKENKNVSRKGWSKVIFRFAMLIVVITFFAPQRATVVLLDWGAAEIIDKSDATYLQPFWGATWAENTLNSFEKSIVVKGRFPKEIPHTSAKHTSGSFKYHVTQNATDGHLFVPSADCNIGTFNHTIYFKGMSATKIATSPSSINLNSLYGSSYAAPPVRTVLGVMI